MWRRNSSFMQSAKSANSNLFKIFYNAAEKEKNKSNGGLYLIIVPKVMVKHKYKNFPAIVQMV